MYKNLVITVAPIVMGARVVASLIAFSHPLIPVTGRPA
jgi:hypothetical protein